MAGSQSVGLEAWRNAWNARKRPLCELFWAGVPLIAQRVSRSLCSTTLDGGYLAAWPGLGAALPPLALLAGLLLGWIGPGGDLLLYQDWLTLGAILLIAVASGFLGLSFAIGFALGDFLLGSPAPQGAASWTEAPLASGVPLLIEYLAIGIFASRLCLIAKGLARQIPLPGFLLGMRHFAAVALLEAAAAGLTSWGWLNALPIVLRPRSTWSGLSEPGNGLETMASVSLTLAVLVALLTLARLALQHYTAFADAFRPWLDHLDRLRQSVPAAEQPLIERIPPRAMLGLQTVFATLMLAGLIESWLDAVLAAAVIATVQAARTGMLPILGPWPRLASRIPVLVRVVAAMALLALLGPGLLLVLFGPLSGMQPMLYITLLSLAVFLLLLPPEAKREPDDRPSRVDRTASAT